MSDTKVDVTAKLEEAVIKKTETEYLQSVAAFFTEAYGKISSAISPTVMAQESSKVQPSQTIVKEVSAVLAPEAGETVCVDGNTDPNNCAGGFALPANESTTITFRAVVNANSTATSIPNTANVTADGGSINQNSNTVNTTVIQPPSISKAFGSSFVSVNGVTTLTFTVTNPNPLQSLTGVAFTDNLPAGLTVADAPGVVNNCSNGTVTAAANATSISYSGGTRAANSNCTIVVNVKGITEGQKDNVTGNISSTNGGQGNTASASITVINSPSLSKSFTPDQIQLGSTSTLQFTLSNPNTSLALNTIAFTDGLPNGVTAVDIGATTICTDGSYSISANVISFTKPTLAAGGNCQFSVTVTGATAGVKSNTTSTVTTSNSAAGAAAAATLTVVAPAAVSKAFSPVSIPAGGTSTVTLTVTNSNQTVALTNASLTDTLSNMTAVGGAVGGTCAGASSNNIAAGATNLSFTGLTIPANSNCAITFDVTSSVAGDHPNTTSGVTSNQTPTAGQVSNTVNLTVVAPPAIAKSFSPSAVSVNGISSLTITITNPAANTVALANVAVTDTFPVGMEVDADPGATNSCPTGSSFSPSAGATGISISGVTIPTNSTCTFSVKVKGTTAGDLVNTTGAVSSSNGGTGATAQATLTVGQFFEADVINRPNGDGFVDADDIQQIRRFSVGLDLPYQSNEFQRADNSPRSSLGDGFVDADDIEQARRYAVGTDAKQSAGGPTAQPTLENTNEETTAETSDLMFLSGVGSIEGEIIGRAVRVINQTTSAGQSVTVPINVDTTGDETGYTFSISFDPNVLQAANVTIGDLGGNVIPNINNTAGTIGFSVTSFAGPNGTIAAVMNQTLVRVQFTAAANAAAGMTQINFTDTPARRRVSGVDPNTPLQQPTYTNGTVTINSPTAASVPVGGRIVDAKGRGIARAQITLTGENGEVRFAATDAFGYYRFTDIAVGRVYVLVIRHKNYEFMPQSLLITDERDDLNFFATPR